MRLPSGESSRLPTVEDSNVSCFAPVHRTAGALQALIAVYDNCNSLHTNSHDEAFTTPTADSVRRAVAIQMIINQEWGLGKTENPGQGAFIIEELTELVEAAVLQEFERISERGGVLGAMETGYQRGKIQDESLTYECPGWAQDERALGGDLQAARPAGVQLLRHRHVDPGGNRR